MAVENEVSATHWTLSFKHRNVTVLLYAHPLTPLTSLRNELLTVVKERYPSGFLQTSASMPSSPSSENVEPPLIIISHPSDSTDIILGKRVSLTDESAGWEQIKSGMDEKATPKSIGLVDGSDVAWSYKDIYDEEGGFVVKRSSYYEDQTADDDDDADDDADDDNGSSADPEEMDED